MRRIEGEIFIDEQCMIFLDIANLKILQKKFGLFVSLTRMLDMFEILKHIINTWRTRGSFAPSSRFLVRRMISKIDLNHDVALLQLWYGNGVFTRELLTRMTPESTLTIFEVDPRCRQYSMNDSRIRYIEDSAEKVSDYCTTKKFDSIISTLPFASLPESICENVFREIYLHLKIRWKFLQFQYSLYSRKDIRWIFCIEPKIDFEFWNFPPAFIYEVLLTDE